MFGFGNKKMTEYDKNKIKSLLKLDEDDIYSEIALYLSESEDTLFGTSNLIRMGKQTFGKMKNLLFELICVKNDFCSRLDDPQFNDKINLVTTLSDIIVSASTSLPIPATVIATLLVKINIRNFCECNRLKSQFKAKQ